jgi:cystathionine beta-lyase/cystathionine gamma-synthase
MAETIPFLNDSDIVTHLGDDYTDYNGAVVPPIYMNSLHVTSKNNMDSPGPWAYGRISNPTVSIFERKIAALEKADKALAFASGMAAISSAILANIKSGGHIITIDSVYYPARVFISEFLKDFGVESTFIPGDDMAGFEKALQPNTSVIYLESPSSHVFLLQDLRKVAALAKEANAVTIVDNSWATPIYQKPLTMGIDLSVHSATKYIGGHSDIIAGVVAGGEAMMKKVQRVREIYGGILGPMEAWLAIRGLRTLPLRLKAQGKSAQYIAAKLEAHPKVKKVYYPGLPSHPQYELAKTQMTGFTSPLSFDIGVGETERKAFIRRLKWFAYGGSWGGHESLIAETPYGILRTYIGLEDRDTLWRDFEQSLDQIKGE